MAPTFQAVGTFQSGGAVQLTVPWPAHAVDDIAFLFVSSNAAVGLLTANGFVQVTDSPQSATGVALEVFWCRATSTSMASPVTNTGSNNITGVILTVRGAIASGDPWDVTAGGTGVLGTAVSIPGDTSTVADCLILYSCGRSGDAASGQFSGEADSNVTNLTEQFDNGTITGNGGGIGLFTANKVTAGTFGPMTATLATTSSKGYWSAAIKPTAGNTGTVAVTEEADTSAISGIVANPVTGTIGATEAADTSNFAGIETLSGVIAATEEDDTSAIAGLVANPISGTIAVTEEDDVAAFVGDSTSPPINGSITVVEEDDTANFTGTVVPPAVTGTIGATEADDTSNLSGFSTVPGTMVVTEQNDTGAFAGTVANPVTGSIVVTEQDDTPAFTALVSSPGTISATEGDDTGNISGTVANPNTGTLDGFETNDTGLFVGTVTGGVVVALKASSVVSSWPVSSTVTSWLVTSEVE